MGRPDAVCARVGTKAAGGGGTTGEIALTLREAVARTLEANPALVEARLDRMLERSEAEVAEEHIKPQWSLGTSAVACGDRQAEDRRDAKLLVGSGMGETGDAQEVCPARKTRHRTPPEADKKVCVVGQTTGGNSFRAVAGARRERGLLTGLPAGRGEADGVRGASWQRRSLQQASDRSALLEVAARVVLQPARCIAHVDRVRRPGEGAEVCPWAMEGNASAAVERIAHAVLPQGPALRDRPRLLRSLVRTRLGRAVLARATAHDPALAPAWTVPPAPGEEPVLWAALAACIAAGPEAETGWTRDAPAPWGGCVAAGVALAERIAAARHRGLIAAYASDPRARTAGGGRRVGRARSHHTA